MKSLCAVLGLSFAILSGAAVAQESATDDGVYVRVGAGATFTDDWSQDITNAPGLAVCLAIGCNPDVQTTSHGGGFIAGGALGFDYTEGIRTELEYRYASSNIDSVIASEAGIESPATFTDGQTKAHFIFSNFYFDWNNNSRFTPFIGAGVGGAFVETVAGEKDAALAYQGRAGISYNLGGGMSLDTEYVFVRTNELSFGPNDEDFVVGSAQVRFDGDRYQSSSVMASFRKKF